MRLLPSFLLAKSLALAALQHVYVDDRHDYLKGKELGSAGAYERIIGTAVYQPNTRVAFDYLKPRDPVKANGALIVLAGNTGRAEEFVDRGYTVLRMKTGDAAAIREFVSFVRYGAKIQTFVLADQRRFIKRAILVGDPRSVESIVLTNATGDKKPYFEGAVVTGKHGFTVPETLKVVSAESRPAEAAMELDAQLKK